MAVWVGSSGPALCSLGAVKKMCRILFPAHAFRLVSGGFSAFGLLCFRGGGLLFRLFCRLLFFGFPGSFLFRFLHFLYPFLQTFMPFLIFFLVGGFDKSVLVGEVHVCEVPQRLDALLSPWPFSQRKWLMKSRLITVFCVSVSLATIFIRCFSSNAKGWSLMPKSGKCLL